MPYRFPLILMLGLLANTAVLAADNPDDPAQLDPIIVEGERTLLDSDAGRYREMLPCIEGEECEPSEDGTPDTLDKVLKGLRELNMANKLPEKPEVYETKGVARPVDSRLDDKQP